MIFAAGVRRPKVKRTILFLSTCAKRRSRACRGHPRLCRRLPCANVLVKFDLEPPMSQHVPLAELRLRRYRLALGLVGDL